MVSRAWMPRANRVELRVVGGHDPLLAFPNNAIGEKGLPMMPALVTGDSGRGPYSLVGLPSAHLPASNLPASVRLVPTLYTAQHVI